MIDTPEMPEDARKILVDLQFKNTDKVLTIVENFADKFAVSQMTKEEKHLYRKKLSEIFKMVAEKSQSLGK